jgi:hypothetical protein
MGFPVSSPMKVNAMLSVMILAAAMCGQQADRRVDANYKPSVGDRAVLGSTCFAELEPDRRAHVHRAIWGPSPQSAKTTVAY